jgi:hypothetical protein
VGDPVRLLLVSVAWATERYRAWRGTDGALLLEHVYQLVGQQHMSGRGPRQVMPGSEHDVAADGIGAGADCSSRRGSLSIHMESNVAEVMAEPGLHQGAGGGVQRLTAAAVQDFMHDAWRTARLADGALLLLAPEQAWLPVFTTHAGAAALRAGRGTPPKYSRAQLAGARSQQAANRPIPDRALQREDFSAGAGGPTPKGCDGTIRDGLPEVGHRGLH